MYTSVATITNIIVSPGKVWLEFTYAEDYFPTHHEFQVGFLYELEKVQFLLKYTKADKVDYLLGKTVRIIVRDDGKSVKSLVGIGSVTRDRFIDLNGDSFPISERRLYHRYEKAKKVNRR